MYYLQSRYYDPFIGRFISADEFASTGQGLLGFNMFAYCSNNPVLVLDPNGKYEVQYDPTTMTYQIKLENSFEVALLCAGKAREICLDVGELVGLGFVTVGTGEIPVVDVLVAYYTMGKLASTGVDIAMNASDIYQMISIFNSKGAVFLVWTPPNSVLDFAINGITSFDVSSQPAIAPKQSINHNNSYACGNAIVVCNYGAGCRLVMEPK